MIQCASDFKDATPCCRATGVLNGNRGICAPFCNPNAGMPAINVRYLPCLDVLPNIGNCFWAGLEPFQ